MKCIKVFVTVLLSFIFAISSYAEQGDFPAHAGLYLGQPSPVAAERRAFAGDSALNAVVGKIEKITEAEARFGLFSGTVLVAASGRILYAKGFSEANREYQVPNGLNTRFNISSIQKPFIAVLVMQLVEQGAIAINDPLTKYLPDCPYASAERIQIRHLLNHTSGLGDYRQQQEYRQKKDELKTLEDALRFAYRDTLAFAPGEKFKYSNTGVLLLKAVIQKVTGKPLEDVLKARIFGPLGMDQTVLHAEGRILSDRATGHELAPDGVSVLRVVEEPSAYAGGGIYTTVQDLLKFDQALYSGELLGEESKRVMFTPEGASRYYGYGWIVVPFGGTMVIYHGGTSGGFSSEFRRYPEKGYTIIVLSNFEEGAFELANRLDCMLLGEEYTLASQGEVYYRRAHLLRAKYQADEAAYGMLLKALDPELFGDMDAGLKHTIEREINAIGYAYLAKGDHSRAIEILLANAQRFPESANVYDSLGDAYEQKGDVGLAAKNYEKALKLNPRKTKRDHERYGEIAEKLKRVKR
jgi:CubicO group peptidase (beta-lactamase class C family)